MTIQLNSKGVSIVKLCFSSMNDFPLQNNKYVIFYSLWPCLSHSLVESHGDRMYLICFVIIFIMAGFENDDNFSLSGLTQQGHELDVTVISSSDDEDDNYGGLLECP